MTDGQLRLWRAIEIDPAKWEQHPYGDQGGGFWVVAVIGRTAIWYNDIALPSAIRPMGVISVWG
jgi:hypothetical protein